MERLFREFDGNDPPQHPNSGFGDFPRVGRSVEAIPGRTMLALRIIAPSATP
jgi:hypothetical protein